MVGLFLDHIDHCSHVEEALPVRVGDGDERLMAGPAYIRV
jgi:hypothetical protein